MIPRWGTRVLKACIVAMCIFYQWLMYLAVVTTQPVAIRVLLILPSIFVIAWATAKTRHKYFWLPTVVGLAAAGILIAEHHTAVYGIPHALIYVSLLWLFGRTLMISGREPFVTRLARRDHGVLSPAFEAYTRKITVVWCVFFAAQLATSALLLTFSSPERWSLFINLLNLPLLVLMFLAEYIYRVVHFPEYSHGSIFRGIQVFTQESSVKRP